MHHFTTDLVRRFGAIFVGDISSQWALAGPLAKSAQDASWAMCKKMLDYKSHAAGVFYEEVKEHFTTQTCSSCKHLPPESPRGRKTYAHTLNGTGLAVGRVMVALFEMYFDQEDETLKLPDTLKARLGV